MINADHQFPHRRIARSIEDSVCSQPRILLVDDDPVFGMWAETKLAKAGLHVVLASDGAIAQCLLKTEPFDVIITDLDMPYLDGFDLIQDIGKSTNCATPLIIVTASTDIKLAAQYRNSQIKLIMNKPVDWNVLIYNLGEILPSEPEAPCAVSTVTGGKADES